MPPRTPSNIVLCFKATKPSGPLPGARAILGLILSAVIAAPAVAKEKKKVAQPARTWKTVVEYVLKNGGEDSIHVSAAQALGYDSEVKAKSLGLEPEKSNDNRDHSIFVVYEKTEKDSSSPKEIVLGTIAVKEAGSKKTIDSYRIRLGLDGTLIKGMHATGIVGQVDQTTLMPDSKELQSVHKKESALYLRELDLTKLVQ